MSSYIDSILTATGEYSAAYIKTPLDQKPVSGCDLPPAVPSTLSLPNIAPIDPTGSTKFCAPLFLQFPVVPAPFSIPENCENGLTFTTKQVGVYAQLTDTTPAATIAVGLNQSSKDFCTYELSIPDVVIPCFPTGPNVHGGLQVNITDKHELLTPVSSTVGFVSNSACDFNLSGPPININIPCSSTGYSVTSNSWAVTDPFTSTVTSLTPTVTGDMCSAVLQLPAINIPCYPGGLVFNDKIRFQGYAFTATQSSGGTAVSSYGIDTSVIDFRTYNASTNPTGLRVPSAPCTWNGVTIPLPFPICDGGFAAKNGTVSSPTAASGLVIKVNDSTTLTNVAPGGTPPSSGGYNTVALAKVSTTITDSNSVSRTQCGYDLSGTINLQLPDLSHAIICSSGVTFNSPSITVAASDSPSTLTLVPTDSSHPLCAFGLVGTINIPSTVISSALSFRGYYDSSVTYSTNSMVVIQSGVSAGTYISVIDSNTYNPAAGYGWIQIAPGNTAGAWS